MKNTKKHTFAFLLLLLVICVSGVVILFFNSTPGSYVWVMDNGGELNEWYLVKMCSNGVRKALIQFGQSGAIGVDPRHGSVWAPELNSLGSVFSDQLVEIDPDWNVVNRLQGYRSGVIAVDPNDGSVWVGLPNEQQIVKLNANGERLLQVAGFPGPASMVVDPRNGSVWIADYHPPSTLVHLTANGDELFRTTTNGFHSNAPHQLALDPQTGTVWYIGQTSAHQLSSEGHNLAVVDGFNRLISISLAPNDGSVWLLDSGAENAGSVVKLNANGIAVLTMPLQYSSHVIGVNPYDETIWIGVDGAMLQLSDKGELLKLINGFASPYSIAFVQSPTDLAARFRYINECYK